MPKLDLAAIPQTNATGYPAPFDRPSRDRIRQRIGDAGGLTGFGVNLTRLPPGNWSSQRHWHSHEDEFVFVLEGEVTLIEDVGRRSCAPARARPFRRIRATAITSSTDRTGMRSIWRSADAWRKMSPSAPTST